MTVLNAEVFNAVPEFTGQRMIEPAIGLTVFTLCSNSETNINPPPSFFPMLDTGVRVARLHCSRFNKDVAQIAMNVATAENLLEVVASDPVFSTEIHCACTHFRLRRQSQPVSPETEFLIEHKHEISKTQVKAPVIFDDGSYLM